MKRNTGSLSSSEANVTTGSDSRKRPFTLSAKNRIVVYERVWLGLPVKGGGVTGGPVKQVMSVKEGKGMFFFSVSVFSGSLAWLGKVLCKCSGNVLIGCVTLYPYRELNITSKVQECFGREFAAKLCEFDYSLDRFLVLKDHMKILIEEDGLLLQQCQSKLGRVPRHC